MFDFLRGNCNKKHFKPFQQIILQQVTTSKKKIKKIIFFRSAVVLYLKLRS